MQVTIVSGLFAVCFYLIGSVFQGLNFTFDKDTRSKVFTFGTMAVIAHGISAYGVIRTASGYHFGISEISTLIAVSISLLVLISSIRKPLENAERYQTVYSRTRRQYGCTDCRAALYS